MEMDFDESKLYYIKQMEKIIAKNCSTGTYNIGNYRYPVHYTKNGKGYCSKSLADVSMQDVSSMHYEFGNHRMNIGKALLEIIDFIEEHCGEFPFDHYSDGED